MKKIVFILILALATFTACQKDPLADSLLSQQQDCVSLSLNLSVESMSAGTTEAAEQSTTYSATKSSLSSEPSTMIKNLWIAQFAADGKVVSSPYYIADYQSLITNDESVEVTLIPSGEEEHTIVYIANSFNDALTLSLGSSYTIDQFKALTYTITDEKSNFKLDDDTYYTVLYGEQEQIISVDDYQLPLCSLTRNVAKINIKLDIDSSLDLKFSDVVVRGVPSVSSYFPDIVEDENFPADGSFSYVNYETEEIADNDATLTFYVPVNMRGEVDNLLDEQKNSYATLYCTSISLVAASTTTGETYIYTIYLGADLTSDFNIKPNTEYTYTIKFNSIGDPDTDLRIEEIGITDFSSESISRSNCYILNPSSLVDNEFIIPIDRIDEFWGDSRYNSDNITGNTLSDIGDNWEAVILWHDNSGDQTYDSATDQIGGFNIEEEYSNNTVRVTLPKEFYSQTNHCNVVFVVRKKAEYDSNQTILWSWHLWITDYDPYSNDIIPSMGIFQYSVTGGELHRYNNDIFKTGIYGGKLIMDRNIGARSASAEGHGWSSFYSTYNGPGSLYYQYGRKDPNPSFGATYVNDYVYTSSTGQVTFAEVVQSPSVFIKQTNYWTIEDDACTATNIWYDYKISNVSYITGKSIFDPSPLGFRVPINGTWSGFSSSSAANEYASPDSYTFKLTNNSYGVLTSTVDRIYNGFAFYPGAGYYAPTGGSLTGLGSYGFCWSATQTGGYACYNLRIQTTSTTTSAEEPPHGFNVRPVQE